MAGGYEAGLKLGHFAFQIPLPLGFRELLDGVAEQGAGHLAVAGKRFFASLRRVTIRSKVMEYERWIPEGCEVILDT